MFGCLLMVISVTIFSCQKNTITPDRSSEASDEIQAGKSNNANDGGSYVLNMVIHLSGDEEVPAVSTTAKGLAHLKVSADKKLYSKVIIQRLESDDALLFSHVHAGAAGVNGPVRIFLCHTADDFGKNIVTDLTDDQYNLLVAGATYVNAHSNFHPGGIVRGQIR